MIDVIKGITSEFLNNFWIQYDDLEVTNQEKNIFLVKIKSEESWLLIWPHWKNIDPINHILKLIIKGNIDEKVKIHLEINDYMKTKDERLESFIISKIKYVEKSWTDLKLPFYSAYERKKIHWFVWNYNNDNIFTKSIWEWSQRRLYICKAKQKLTIDIDWDDI